MKENIKQKFKLFVEKIKTNRLKQKEEEKKYDNEIIEADKAAGRVPFKEKFSKEYISKRKLEIKNSLKKENIKIVFASKVESSKKTFKNLPQNSKTFFANWFKESTKNLTLGSFFMNILKGMSIGVIVALVPYAIFWQIADWSGWQQGMDISKGMSIPFLGATMGVATAMMFKCTPIETATMAIVGMIGTGTIKQLKGPVTLLHGSGDVINGALTIMFGMIVILIIGKKLKAFTILLVPTITIVIAGAIGLNTFEGIHQITTSIGKGVANVTKLQPVIMAALIAPIFALIIMSPISSVGIALAISLTGLGSAAANLGITAAGFGLCILGWRSNPFGTSIAHFLGSPKMQMANFIRRPKIIIPVLLMAFFLGLTAGIMSETGAFEAVGTPISAGFGFSGLIGPLAAAKHFGDVTTALEGFYIALLWVILPIIFGITANILFTKLTTWIKPQHYKLDFK